VLTWEHTVKSNAAKLDATVSSLKRQGKLDLPSTRAKLASFLAGLVKATHSLSAKINAVGAPNVKNGAKLQSGVLTAFAQIAKAFDDGRKSALKLPVTSPKAFSRAAGSLATTIQSTTNRVGAAFSALNKYSSKPIDDAAKKDPACTKL
jgi:hypothetical protein